MEIAIIGGGITGLTTAIALNKMGIASTVYERAAQLDEVGAGIWLQPNAMKVLNHLGLGERIEQNGIKLGRVDITNENLIPFKKTNNLVTDDEGNQIVSIHRAALQKILVEALPKEKVQLGKELVSVSQSPERITLNFHDSTINCDFVLAADGINSNIRKQIFPDSSLRHSGQTCWRGISTMELPTEFRGMGREAWGRNLRFGFSQISDGQAYWFAVANLKADEEKKSLKTKAKLLDLFHGFHPIIHQLLNNTDEGKIIKGDLLDLNRLDSWHQNNICLVGDAAHATTPNMGQGAGQGIEDAYVLSNLWAKKKDAKYLFDSFENVRRDKVDYVVNNSWRFGKMAHNKVGRMLMKSIMILTPASVMNKQLDKLYSLPEL